MDFQYQAKLINSACMDEVLFSFADAHVDFCKTYLNVVGKSVRFSADIFFFNSKTIRISCCSDEDTLCSREC